MRDLAPRCRCRAALYAGSYSPSGEVTAPLVYANYGRPEDFDALEAADVSVEGAIIITRYGEEEGGSLSGDAGGRTSSCAFLFASSQRSTAVVFLIV